MIRIQSDGKDNCAGLYNFTCLSKINMYAGPIERPPMASPINHQAAVHLILGSECVDWGKQTWLLAHSATYLLCELGQGTNLSSVLLFNGPGLKKAKRQWQWRENKNLKYSARRPGAADLHSVTTLGLVFRQECTTLSDLGSFPNAPLNHDCSKADE